MKFRVRSRDLPAYRAMTFDLSQTGVQLETEGALQPGAELELDLEFDREDVQDFSCHARVIWSRPDLHRRSRFRNGLAFLPADDQQRTALARMATVLQTRSDSDLETLLDEAKRLDPERAETFARVRSHLIEQDKAHPERPRSGRRELPMLGVFIPLRVAIEGYSWNRQTQMLEIQFVDDAESHSLYFPHSRLLTDYGCSTRPTVAGLFCTPHSDAIKNLAKPSPKVGWKHYRFLLPDRQPILELISWPCQTSSVSPLN